MEVKIVCALLTILAMAVACEPMNERYNVLLKDDASDFELEQFIQTVEVHAFSTREELFMFSDNSLLPYIYGNFSEATAKMISELDYVDFIEKDQIVTIETTMSNLDDIYIDDAEVDNATIFGESTNRYNLDVIDDINCIDGTFIPFNDGTGADIYVLDTGVNYDHIDFNYPNAQAGSNSRASFGGFDAFNPSNQGRDLNGHGTHCAGIAAGLYSGVAKGANIISIRVMDSRGSGSYSGIMQGVIAVLNKHEAKKDRPDFVATIISMSIGGQRYMSLNNMINQAISRGIIVVTASGNQKISACKISPGSAGMNINVGSHGYRTNCDKPLSTFSNYGPCVKIIAPGESILSADYISNTKFKKLSGTSMAAPHVSGMAAIMKSADPSLSPDRIKMRIVAVAQGDINRSRMTNKARRISISKRAYLTEDMMNN